MYVVIFKSSFRFLNIKIYFFSFISLKWKEEPVVPEEFYFSFIVMKIKLRVWENKLDEWGTQNFVNFFLRRTLYTIFLCLTRLQSKFNEPKLVCVVISSKFPISLALIRTIKVLNIENFLFFFRFKRKRVLVTVFKRYNIFKFSPFYLASFFVFIIFKIYLIKFKFAMFRLHSSKILKGELKSVFLWHKHLWNVHIANHQIA